MKLDRLKFPTGKRLTSWLCTSAAAELNLAQLVVRAGLELGITRLQPPLHGVISYHCIKICPMPELLVLCAMGRFSGKMVRSLTCILIGCIFYRELQMNTRTHPPAHLFPFPSFEVTNLCWFKKKGSFYPKIFYQVSLSLCTLLLRFFSDLKSNLCSNKLSERSTKPSNSSHVDCRNLNKKSAFISVRRIPLIFFYFNP